MYLRGMANYSLPLTRVVGAFTLFWGTVSSVFAIDLDSFRSIMESNSRVLSTYQGTSVTEQYLLVELGDDGAKSLRASPFLTSRISINFTFDRTRSHDYRAEVHTDWFAIAGQKGTSRLLEKRLRDEIQAVFFDGDKPLNALISPPSTASVEAIYPDPFQQLYAHAFLRRNNVPDGFVLLPLHESLSESSRYWIDETPSQVSGQRTIKLVTTHRLSDGAELVSYSWLAPQMNYIAVKQETRLLPPPDQLGRKRAQDELQSKLQREPNLQDWAELLSKEAPISIIYSKKFFEISPNVWIPVEIEEFSPVGIEGDAPGGSPTYAPFYPIFEKYPEALPYKGSKMVPGNVRRTTINVEKLRVNIPISSALFEESVIPPGVPVTNLVVGVTPVNFDKAIDKTIQSLGGANATGESKSPSRMDSDGQTSQNMKPSIKSSIAEFTRNHKAKIWYITVGIIMLFLAMLSAIGMAFSKRRGHKT
jgi:hypothetical protein